jgi:hypothetical protein
MVWETREVREETGLRHMSSTYPTLHSMTLAFWLMPFKFQMMTMHQGPVP